MKVGSLVLILILFAMPMKKLFGQNEDTLLTDRLYLDGHAYPDFLFNERHAWFRVGYLISNSTAFEVQGHHDRYVHQERFRLPIMVKQYFNTNFYLFSGVEYDFKMGNTRNPQDQDFLLDKAYKPRLDYIGGMGYEAKEGFMIEVKTNQQLNNSKLPYFGQRTNNGKNSVLSLGGRLSF